MKKIKDSLITIDQVSDYLDSFSAADICNRIDEAMALAFTLYINIILFPIVIFRLLKK